MSNPKSSTSTRSTTTTPTAGASPNPIGLAFSLPTFSLPTFSLPQLPSTLFGQPLPTGNGIPDWTQISLSSLIPRLPQWDQLPQLPPLPDVSNIPILAQLASLPVFFAAQIKPVYNFVAGLQNAVVDVAASLPFMQTTIPMLLGTNLTMEIATDGRQYRSTTETLSPPAAPVVGVAALPALNFKADNPLVVSAPAEVPAVRAPQPTTFSARHEIVAGPEFRAGYPDYLRAAGFSEVAAVAVPGFTGILVLTGAGGLLGYRQARAGHLVGRSGTARFMS